MNNQIPPDPKTKTPITVRDIVRNRFCKCASETWVALCRLENEEISKGKALQIIQEEAEQLERESWEEQSQYADDLERRLTAAQRENDRLAGEVAVLDEIMKGERIVTPVNKEHAQWMYRAAFDYLNAARAATEEGK